MKRFTKCFPMRAKKIFLVTVLVTLIGVVFFQIKTVSADRETVISNFEDPLDIRMWNITQGKTESKLEYETNIVNKGKGAMKISRTFMLPGHEWLIFEKAVDISIGDRSRDGIQFFINPDELDLKNNYEISISLVDNGEVWSYRWWSTSAFLSNGWNQIDIGLDEFKFAWGGNGDDNNDNLIDGDRISLIFFEFSDEPNVALGKESSIIAAFYLDEIKYLQNIKKPIQNKYKTNPLPEINYFESEEDINKWRLGKGVTLELSTEHVTQGNYSAKLTFPVPDPLDKTTLIASLPHQAYQSKDWSNYGMLVMDFYNPNAFTVPLLLEIPDLFQQVSYITPFQHLSKRISIFVPTESLGVENLYPINDVREIRLYVKYHTTNPADFSPENPIGDKISIFIDNFKLVTKGDAKNIINKSNPIEPVRSKDISIKKFTPLSVYEKARFRGLNIFWMKEDSDIKKYEFAKEFATLIPIVKNQLNFYVGLPKSVEQLKKYDVVIFDDVDSNVFTKEQLEMVKEYYNQGGAVMMIGGWASFGAHGSVGGQNHPGYRGTPVEDILPVKILPSPDDCSGGMNFSVTEPEHPVMRNIPWEEIPVRWYNVVIPKQDSTVLAVDANIKERITPIVVIGKRSLVFASIDSRGGAAMLKWKPWERFVIQGLNYITADREIKKVVCETMNIPENSGVGTQLKGKINLVNLSKENKNPTIEVEIISDAEKSILKNEVSISNMAPEEQKEIDLAISIPETIVPGEYTLRSVIIENNEILDMYQQKLNILPQVYARLDIPDPPYFENGNIPCWSIIKNFRSSPVNANIHIDLEQEGNVIRELFNKDLTVEPGKEDIIPHNFSISGIKKGYYTVRNTITVGRNVLDTGKYPLWIYPEYMSVQQRDFNFLFLSHTHWADEIMVHPLFEEIGFFKLGYGPVMMSYPEWSVRINMEGEGFEQDLKSTVVPHFKHLSERKIPFFVGVYGGWHLGGQPLELIMERVRRVVQWANEIGKEYFVGIRFGEIDGIAYYYRAITQETNRIDKANAYIKVMKKLRDDTGLPPGKLVMAYPSIFFNWGLDYEAGADVVTKVTPFQWNNLEINQAQLRGMSRSFDKKKYGIGTATDQACHVPSYYDKKSGRYDGIRRMDFSWTWSQQDLFKFWIQGYYNGIGYIDAYYQPVLRAGILTEEGRTTKKFLDFVDTNPRCKDIVSKIAIVRSKGDFWGGTSGNKMEDVNYTPQYFGPWMNSEGKPSKEEADYNYLNIFFPNFSDDAAYTKSLWTGTPYGAIDIIYPAMKFSEMKRYNVIIFLGYHRMDSVKTDFLDDLIKYVDEGGIVLISADQLKNSFDKFNSSEVEKFTGLQILDAKSTLRDFVDVTDSTVFEFNKKKYEIPSEVKLANEKEPWLYKVEPVKAEVIAKDGNDNPVITLNKYGKGFVILFTTPTLSMIPPSGRNLPVNDIIDKVSRYMGLPINITPEYENIEFLISTTDNREAIIFIMNHGPEDWQGDVIIDTNISKLSKDIGKRVSAKILTGQDKIIAMTPPMEKKGNKIIIKGIKLQGDTGDSYAYRQANFAVIKLSE